MSAQDPPPPPPPPHGQNPRPPGAMPDGNYDIFIIPPHSAGSGFLYLPSLGTQRNSFLAGVACTLLAVGVYTLVMPVLKEWMATVVASGGMGVLLLVVGVGVAGWAWGKTQEEGDRRHREGGAGSASAGTGPQQRSRQQHAPPPPPPPPPPPQHEEPPPPPPPPPPPEPPKPEPSKPHPKSPPPRPAAASGWEKAREETRKREEARKREEELKRVREELQRKREEAEKAAKAKADKEKWEQVRAREKERREREARERIQREREAKTNAEKNKAGSAPAPSTRASPTKDRAPSYARPTAKSYAGTEEGAYSYRPYDTAPKTHTHKSSASSISGLSESSYAPSATTARTTPPPSQRGPYSTRDPGKIQIKAVYLFSDSFPNKPTSSLIANTGHVTDGLVLRLNTEGLFIDDDIRGVPLREWDVKAWTVKQLEDGVCTGASSKGGSGLHVVRATTRDLENKKYVFVLEETEAWKVAVGLAALRKGSQQKVLGMGVGGMKEGEVRGLLASLGWA